MARLYESSTDYEEHITYAGATIADDYDNPDYLYDREQLAYDGGTTDILSGYASTAITYASATSGYNGSKTVDRTATGDGTGTSTTVSVRIAFRTATGDGTGTSTTARTIVRLRTATGSGQGASNNSIVHKQLRTAFGAGAATAGDIAIGIHVHVRTGTNNGTGTQNATSLHISIRDADGSGAGAADNVTWIKSLIFRPPNDDDFPWADYRQQTSKAHRLFGFVGQGVRARNVFKLVDGTFTNDDPLDPALVDKVYYGAHVHFVTADEKADLVAAGYEVT